VTRLQVLAAGVLLLAAAQLYCLSSTAVIASAGLPDRVPVHIDDAQVVTLEGNLHPLARGEFEVGVVPADTRLNRMMLLLKPSPTQQAALDSLTAAQQDPQSPQYHQWLTPAEYAARFGVSDHDLARITQWLAAHGFTVDEVAASHRLVVFSGNAGQVADTFHTEMRRYQVEGALHIANSQNPQVPAALAGVVAGVVSLHDFRHSPQMHIERAIGARPEWNFGGAHFLYPADFAAIYDVNPLYTAGTTGAGVSLAIAGRSNIKLSDVTAFRSAAGLSVNNPLVLLNGPDPGIVPGDQDESTLDVEWAGAVAPAAAVTLVASESSATTDGVDLSSTYIVNHASAPVLSTSYGNCEQDMGSAEMAFYNSLWQQASSQGISVFVAAGDAGASGCDSGSDSVGSFAAVNGICSSPYATCVGGTEFNEGTNPAQFWAGANTSNNSSAAGYIPETVWNESGSNGGGGLWSSGGGASTVYPQPSWQQGVNGTSEANGKRAVPDVSLTSAGHDGYVIFENGGYLIASGTSLATPSFAALMALIVQRNNGHGQGNANPELYGLLRASTNPFHATATGNNTVPGVTGFTATGMEYNLATGLGSVDANLLVGILGKSPSAPLPRLPVRGAPAMPIATRVMVR
jgi:pseudomonalisin